MLKANVLKANVLKANVLKANVLKANVLKAIVLKAFNNFPSSFADLCFTTYFKCTLDWFQRIVTLLFVVCLEC